MKFLANSAEISVPETTDVFASDRTSILAIFDRFDFSSPLEIFLFMCSLFTVCEPWMVCYHQKQM